MFKLDFTTFPGNTRQRLEKLGKPWNTQVIVVIPKLLDKIDELERKKNDRIRGRRIRNINISTRIITRKTLPSNDKRSPIRSIKG